MNIIQAMEILGLEPGYTNEELLLNWRSLAKLYHPDRNHSVGATQTFVLINSAHQVLKGRLDNSHRGINQDWYDNMTREAYRASQSAKDNGHQTQSGIYHNESNTKLFYVESLCQIVFTLTPIIFVIGYANNNPEIYQQIYDAQLETACLTGTFFGALSKLNFTLGKM